MVASPGPTGHFKKVEVHIGVTANLKGKLCWTYKLVFRRSYRLLQLKLVSPLTSITSFRLVDFMCQMSHFLSQCTTFIHPPNSMECSQCLIFCPNLVGLFDMKHIRVLQCRHFDIYSEIFRLSGIRFREISAPFVQAIVAMAHRWCERQTAEWHTYGVRFAWSFLLRPCRFGFF